MAIEQLTEEQIRTLTVAEKDRWWLENVYQGDVPQMTVRVVVMGFLLGELKHLDDRVRQVQRKLAQHEAGAERLADAEVSFRRRNLERLEDGCAKLLKQVDAILPPASAENP